MIARFIIEIMARPESIVQATLKKVVDSVKERYKVVRTHYSKTEKVKDSDLYSAFTEFDFEAKKFEDLFAAILDYGPTVVEIIEPKKIDVDRSELQSSVADLIAKIHFMSQTIQMLQLENMQLKNEAGAAKKVITKI